MAFPYHGPAFRLRVPPGLPFPYGQLPSTARLLLIFVANATGIGGWEAAFSRAQSFIGQLTNEEKFTMVIGTAGYVGQ